MNNYFTIQQADREANVFIYGDIVPYEWDESDVSADGIAKQIKGLDVDVINVHIDSYGGAVSEGWAIYNALRNHPAKVVSHGDGFVASAALYPFLAGDERLASNLSAFFFHQVLTEARGYADDLRAAADEIELMTEIGINAFVERTGMTADEVRGLMKAETWLSPAQALSRGLATGIKQMPQMSIAQDARKQILDTLLVAEQKAPKNKILKLFERK